MSAVDTAIAEVLAALADLEPKIEGLRDFARLDLGPAARTAIEATLQGYQDRKSRLVQASDACRRLTEAGYPELQHEDVSQAVFAELQDNLRTISLALGQFGPVEQAVALGLQASTAQPK